MVAAKPLALNPNLPIDVQIREIERALQQLFDRCNQDHSNLRKLTDAFDIDYGTDRLMNLLKSRHGHSTAMPDAAGDNADHDARYYTQYQIGRIVNGTATYIPKIKTNGKSLEDSLLSDDGSSVASAGHINLAATKVLKVSGTQVITAQQAAIASAATDASEAHSVADAAAQSALDALGAKLNDVAAVVNLILGAMRTHGLISSGYALADTRALVSFGLINPSANTYAVGIVTLGMFDTA